MMVYKNFVNLLINFKLGTLSSPHHLIPEVLDHFDGDSTVLGFVEGVAGVAVEGRQGKPLTETQRHGEKFLPGTPTSFVGIIAFPR